MSYERARGGRQVGQREDGFTVTASKTVAVPVERLYDAFVDPAARAGWLPDAHAAGAHRHAARPARFDWGDDERARARDVRGQGRRQGRPSASSTHGSADAEQAPS